MFRKSLTALLMGSMLLFGMTLSASAEDETPAGDQDQYRTGNQDRIREHQGDQTGDQDRLREQKRDQTGDRDRVRAETSDMVRGRSMQRDRDMTHQPMGSGPLEPRSGRTGSGAGRGGSRR